MNNHILYVCTKCNKMYFNQPDCGHNYVIINCTKEEYDKMKMSNNIRDKIQPKED